MVPLNSFTFEGAEFTYNSHEQTFLSTLCILVSRRVSCLDETSETRICETAHRQIGRREEEWVTMTEE